MIDKEILELHGVSTEKWKALLTLPERKKAAPSKKGKASSGSPVVGVEKYEDDKLNLLVERIKTRCQSGREQNTKNYRTIRALDLIWDAPYRQVSPTLLADIASNCKTTEQVNKALTMYGFDLDTSFTLERDPKTGDEVKKLNAPMFFSITIPLVHAMLTTRKAKIVNDRNRPDFFDFPAAVNSRKNRLKCSAVKSRANRMAQQYNYLATLDQAVHQMLLYGHAMAFTIESWHWEEQLRWKTKKKDAAKPVKLKKGEKKEEPSDYETYVTKEGLRHIIPHPARCFWDRSHPVKTFNTETGCDWAGHWNVIPYKELTKNKEFWNVDNIATGDVSWWSSNAAFLNVFFSTCVINAPGSLSSVTQNPPRQTQDRQSFIEDSGYYTQAQEDRSLCLFEYRERLVPKDNGLGDYPHPIWARFVCAGDGTIVFAEPLCYRAVFIFKDNGDEKRMEDASFALKLAPFQDQLSNLISQYLLSVKQNLAQYTLIDENVLSKEEIVRLKNLGEEWFRTLNISTFDSKRTHKQRDNIGAAIYSHRFPQIDTQSILNAARTVIELAERVLNFSSQEVGQAASHEQSKAEVVQIEGVTSNILQYTTIPVDDGIHAWGLQVYEGWMNYGEDDFTAELPFEEGVDKALIEELGFSFVDDDVKASDGRANVSGKKSKVLVDLMSFSQKPNSGKENADADTARVLSEWVRDMMNSPYAESIGADQYIAIQNAISKMLRLPVDAPIKNTGATKEQQAAEAKAQLQKLIDQVKGSFAGEIEGKLLNEVKDGMVPVLQKQEQTSQKVDFIWTKILQLPPLSNEQQPAAQPPVPAPPVGLA